MEKVLSDCKTFGHKGCKIALQSKNSFLANFALLAGFYGIGATKGYVLRLPYIKSKTKLYMEIILPKLKLTLFDQHKLKLDHIILCRENFLYFMDGLHSGNLDIPYSQCF